MVIFASVGDSSDVLASGKSLFKREADWFISRLSRAFPTEDLTVMEEALSALSRFVNEVVEWNDPESGFRMYALAHAMRMTPGEESVGDFMARFGVKLLSEAGVNLMCKEGIIIEERRIDMVHLFTIASEFGIDQSELLTLVRLPVEALATKMRHVSWTESVAVFRGQELTDKELGQRLGLLNWFHWSNPSAARFISILKMNNSHIFSPFQYASHVDNFVVYEEFKTQREQFLELRHVSRAMWKNPWAMRMFDSLGEIVETLPYIRTYEVNSQNIVKKAFQALISVISSLHAAPGLEFEQLTVQLETSCMEAFRNEAKKDEIKLLRDKIVNWQPISFKLKFSILQKLVWLIDHASLLVNRIYKIRRTGGFNNLVENKRDYTRVVALVTAVVDTTLSILSDPAANKPLIGLADTIAQLTLIVRSITTKSEMDKFFFEETVLKTTFDFYRLFGVYILQSTVARESLLEGWSQDRVEAVRVIMESFVIFGKHEWKTLFSPNMSFCRSSKFVARLSRVPEDRLAFVSQQLMSSRIELFVHDPLTLLGSPVEWIRRLLEESIGGHPVTDVLASGRKFFRREADALMRNVRDRFGEGNAANTVIALESFIEEVIQCEAPEWEFGIYALGHAIRDVPEDTLIRVFDKNTVSDFFASFALGILSQVNGVNLMISKEGVVAVPEQRVDVANLLSYAAEFGLDLNDAYRLLHLAESALGTRVERVSAAILARAMLGEETWMHSIRQWLDLISCYDYSSSCRLWYLLNDNVALKPESKSGELVVRTEDFVRQRQFWLTEQKPITGTPFHESVKRMINSLGDIVETFPYIRSTVNELNNCQSVFHNAFEAVIDVVRNAQPSSTPPGHDFQRLLDQLETSCVESFTREANKDKLKLLRNKVVYREQNSWHDKISIIPKLVLYIDRASLLVNRIHRGLRYHLFMQSWKKEKAYSKVLALVTAVVDTSLSILDNPENENKLVGLAEIIRFNTNAVDEMKPNNGDDSYSMESLALQTTFEVYRRYGLFHLIEAGEVMKDWSPERVKAIRIIMKSFLIFGKREWNKLLLSDDQPPKQFVFYFTRATQDQVDKAVKFLARHALWRMKMYRHEKFQDSSLFSPAEWLKLFWGNSKSSYAVWELSWTRDPLNILAASIPQEDLQREILSYLPIDPNIPTEIAALAHQISTAYEEIWSRRRLETGLRGNLFRTISEPLLSLPRLVLQVEAEWDMLDKNEYLYCREILLQSAQSLSDLVLVAATTDSVHFRNIDNIETGTRIIQRILDFLRFASFKTWWPSRWARTKVLTNKIGSLRKVIRIIQLVNDDIQNRRFTSRRFRQLDGII